MSKSASVSSHPPAAPHGDASLFDDRSAVRPRMRPAFDRDDFERKLRFARIVLQLLSADDPRARRLHAAMLARDPAQLDSVLSSLDESSDRQ